MTQTRELGKITSARLGIEDHGIMTFILGFDFGDTWQGFGTYTLDQYDEKKKKRVGTAFGCECIRRILEAVGVNWWEELVGKEMWVVREGELIVGIEAPKYRKSASKPFFIKELAKEYKEKNEE